jgi:micrococcal nuclease
VGKILPFRRRRRWTRPRAYGSGPPFWPDKKRITLRGFVRDFLFWLRPVGLFAGILILWPTLDPALIEPPGFLSSDPVIVDAKFGRCGRTPGNACVVDGDTFRLGKRRIRIIGIDAPETHPPGCAEEARLGEAATVQLQELLNEGPFEMTGRIDDMKDRYGRHLRVITRMRPDGSEQSIAEDMQEAGLAKAYLGGFKSAWC